MGPSVALGAYFDLEADEHRIEVPPSLRWGREALIGGHLCAVRIVRTLSETFAVEPCYPGKKLEEDFHYVWVGATVEQPSPK